MIIYVILENQCSGYHKYTDEPTYEEIYITAFLDKEKAEEFCNKNKNYYIETVEAEYNARV